MSVDQTLPLGLGLTTRDYSAGWTHSSCDVHL